jgi:hypothetical protein
MKKPSRRGLFVMDLEQENRVLTRKLDAAREVILQLAGEKLALEGKNMQLRETVDEYRRRYDLRPGVCVRVTR